MLKIIYISSPAVIYGRALPRCEHLTKPSSTYTNVHNNFPAYFIMNQSEHMTSIKSITNSLKVNEIRIQKRTKVKFDEFTASLFSFKTVLKPN